MSVLNLACLIECAQKQGCVPSMSVVNSLMQTRQFMSISFIHASHLQCWCQTNLACRVVAVPMECLAPQVPLPPLPILRSQAPPQEPHRLLLCYRRLTPARCLLVDYLQTSTRVFKVYIFLVVYSELFPLIASILC